MRAIIWCCSFLIAACLLMPSESLVSAASARQFCERVTYEQSILKCLHLKLRQDTLDWLISYLNMRVVKR